MALRWKAYITSAAAGFLVMGCTSLGPSTINHNRLEYTTVLSDSWKSQMLFNMVRLRYGDAPVFLDVVSIINSYEVSGSGSAGANLLSGATQQSGVNIGGQIFSANRPTITYSPLTGEKFARSLMSPVPPFSILSLVQAGYSVDLVFRLLVQSVNGVRNSQHQIAAKWAADPDFYPLLEKLRRIQQSGAIGIQAEKKNKEETMMLVFKEDKIPPDSAADSIAVRNILGLDPKARSFNVKYGLIKGGDNEIAILSRSMIQVLVDIAARVDIPESHETQKRANPTIREVDAGGLPVVPMVRISSSTQKPEDAFVSIQYRDYWFWIDDKDVKSKQVFSFLMFIFTLVETEGKDAAPVITIPVR